MAQLLTGDMHSSGGTGCAWQEPQAGSGKPLLLCWGLGQRGCAAGKLLRCMCGPPLHVTCVCDTPLLCPLQVRRQREYEAQQSAATPAIPVAKPGQQAAAGQQQAAAAAAPPSLFGTPGAAPAAAASPAAAGTPAPAFGAPSPQPFGGFGSAFGQTPQQNTLARSKSSTSGSGQRRKR